MGNSVNNNAVFQVKSRYYLQALNRENKIVLISDILQANTGRVNHKMLETYTYVYRGTKFTYAQLCKNEAATLEIASMYSNDNISNKEIYGGSGLKTCFIIRLYETLERYINKARFETICAANRLSVDFLNSDISYHEYDFYYQQRCYNAENAIYSYYAAFEILMQIVWIYNGLNEDKQTLKKALKSYSTPDGLIKKLKICDDANFVDLICEDSKQNSIKKEYSKVRSWCNKFKHRGVLEFEGNDVPNKITVEVKYEEPSKTKKGQKDYSSKNMQYEFIDLDNEVIPELISYHKNLFSLCDKIIKKIEI
ncbi:MAG: hypothetical protein RR347_05285 [Anaerovoracaceae bacterium]